MKKIITWSFITLVLTLIVAVVPTEAEARIYEDTVRLHILAASDSEEDQELKYALRDALLNRYSDVLSEKTDADGASSRY